MSSESKKYINDYLRLFINVNFKERIYEKNLLSSSINNDTPCRMWT